LKGPNGQYYANTGAKQQTSARLSARLSTASTAVRAAVLRAARMGVELPGDVTIRVRELGGVGGGGAHGDGISKAVVDVTSPEARSEQAEGGHERAAVGAEELIDVDSTQLEGANRLDARDEVDDDEDVSGAVAERTGDKCKVLAVLAILHQLCRDR